MSVAAHVVASTNHETIMRDADDTGCRSSAWWSLAAVLVPTLMACGEGKILVPPAGAPTAPEPPLTAFIYIADANGAVPGELTAGDWPSWSPDGRRIVFHRDGHVRVVGADGVGDTELAAGQWPTLSPDGDRIAYATREGIRVMNADGSAARLLMSPALFAMHATGGVGKLSWSPDGALIAFEHLELLGDGEGVDLPWILAMSADGATQYFLAGYSAYETEPSWSPEGSRVVYWSSGYGIGIVERGGGPTTRLYKDGAVWSNARPAWSPDGRTIAFSTRGPVSSIVTVSMDGTQSSMAGTITRALIPNGFNAAWSPDGKRIAFVRLRER